MRKYLLVNANEMLPAIVPGTTAQGNGIVIDREEYYSAKFNLAAATITAGSITFKIQHGDLANGSDMADYTNPLDESGDPETLTVSDTNTTYFVDLTAAKRYVRVVTTITGTVSAHSCHAILADGIYTENFFDGE